MNALFAKGDGKGVIRRIPVPKGAECAYARPGTPAPVPVVEYAATLATLADRRRQAEVLEEQLVLEAAESGMAIARRPDADPVVVLTTVLAE